MLNERLKEVKFAGRIRRISAMPFVGENSSEISLHCQQLGLPAPQPAAGTEFAM
jgi:hypothetical protein